MKYWFDTEFLEDGRTIELLSIGIVAEDGRTFYAESHLAGDWSRHPEHCHDDWLRKNVIPHLKGYPYVCGRENLKLSIRGFCDPEVYGPPEFWAYYADYDWVVFCQLFGRMIDLPKGFPMYCRDLKQWMDQLGVSRDALPAQSEKAHHALADAEWNYAAYQKLAALAGSVPSSETKPSEPQASQSVPIQESDGETK